MDVNIVISTLQRKVSELTLANTMLEAKVLDLTAQVNQLNTINQEKPSENAINGNEDQTQKLNDGFSDTDKPRST
ncbi:MAG: hypothetical protein CMA77_04980 [Euryarchaeota archaeon]|nr:hypothetical protein [Euryarchaeota archaeon]|tara:strand:- start:83 stop:307 length:225 start_codon:yes stop_codon:yes gene_type:complete